MHCGPYRCSLTFLLTLSLHMIKVLSEWCWPTVFVFVHYMRSTMISVYTLGLCHGPECELSLVKPLNLSDIMLGMYRIAIFKIRPELDSTGYQTNYPAGTGYLDTCCIIAYFLVYFVVRIKNVGYYSLCLFSALCAQCSHTARSTTNMLNSWST